MDAVFQNLLLFMTVYPALNDFPQCCSPANCLPTGFHSEFVGDQAHVIAYTIFTQMDALLDCFRYGRMSSTQKNAFEDLVRAGLYTWISARLQFGSLAQFGKTLLSNAQFEDDVLPPFLFDILLPETLVLFCPPSACASPFVHEWTTHRSSPNALVNALPRIDDTCTRQEQTMNDAKDLLSKLLLIDLHRVDMSVVAAQTWTCALRVYVLTTVASTALLLVSAIVLWLWLRRQRKTPWWTLLLVIVAVALPTAIVIGTIETLLALIRGLEKGEEWRAVLLLWQSRCTTWCAVHDVLSLLYATILILLARRTSDTRVKTACIGLAAITAVINVINLIQNKG